MALTIETVLLVLWSLNVIYCQGPSNTVYDNELREFRYELTATAMFGRMAVDAPPNSFVPIDTNVAQEEGETSSGAKYLQLILWEDLLFNNNSSARNSSDVKLLHNGHVTPRYRRLANKELPPNVKFDLSRLQSSIPTPDVDEPFSISEDKYIVIDDDPIFKTAEAVDFWVVAIRQSPGQPDEVVSSPVTFVVRIDHEEQQGQGAALYAGVIVAVICIFALLIPFTVRTKRRLQQGKPICACGSASKPEAKSDTNGSALNDRKQSQDNLAAILNETETAGLKHQTIQSHALQSTSALHFQPHWRDPHFSSSYERPSRYVKASQVTRPTDPKHPSDVTPPTDPKHPSDVTHPTDPKHPSDVTHPTDPKHPSDVTHPSCGATGDQVSTDKIEEMPSTSSMLHLLHKF